MPLSLKSLTSKTATKSIDFGGGDVLNVTYFPARISGKMIAYYGGVTSVDQIKAMPHDEGLAYTISPAKTLAMLVDGWDMTDTADDGTEQPYPPDLAHIEELGVEIQWKILDGLLSSDPNAADAKSSAPAQVDGAANGSPNATPLPDTSSPTAA